MIIEVSAYDPNILCVASTHKDLFSSLKCVKVLFLYWKYMSNDTEKHISVRYYFYSHADTWEKKNNIKYFETRIPKGHNGTVNKMHLHFLYVFTGQSFSMMHGQITSQINHANSVIIGFFFSFGHLLKVIYQFLLPNSGTKVLYKNKCFLTYCNMKFENYITL